MAPDDPVPVVAVLSVHNRRATTERALTLLDAAAARASVSLRRVIVDDGSTDGTWQLLHDLRRDGDVFVRDDGSLWWAGAMRRGLAELEGMEPYEHVLLLNDDVTLRPDALTVLLARAEGRPDRVVVGQLVDPVSGAATYGGWRGRTRRRPFGYRLTDDPEGQLEGMNGNAVLVGHEAFGRLGNLSTSFRHGFADFDYALRANRLGLQVLLSRSVVGECPRNPSTGTWRDPRLPRRERQRLMRAPTGMPPGEWLVFAWRHGGVWGLRYVVWDWASLLRRRRR